MDLDRIPRHFFKFIFWIALVVPAAAQTVNHPLDPLSAEELVATRDILKASGQFSNGTEFGWIELSEPPKKIVLDYAPGAEFPRQVHVAVIDYDKGKAWRVIVDLRAKKIASQTDLGVRQPGIIVADYRRADSIIDADARIKEALIKRGLNIPGKTTDTVRLRYYPVAIDNTLDRQTGRLMRILFSADQKAQSDTSANIEGLMAIVDLYAKKVIRLEDVPGAKSAPVPHDVFDAKVRGAPLTAKAIAAAQPDGRNFTINNHSIDWLNWQLRFSFNHREGLVLHQIQFRDGDHARSIAYRASVSEILTSYAGPNGYWSWAQILDEALFGLGHLAIPVRAGYQVPSNAVTVAVPVPDLAATNFVTDNSDLIYVYERNAGSLIYYDELDRAVHAPASELVAGFFVALGNYVYGLNWIFKQDGSFGFEAQLLGAIVTTFTDATTCKSCPAIAEPNDRKPAHREQSEQFADVLLPNLVGLGHQHWFNLRIDFDLDGVRNAVMETNVGTGHQSPAAKTPAIITSRKVFELAASAKRHMNHETSRTWTIYNPTATNRMMRVPGYTVMPGDNTMTILPAAWQKGPAAFTFNHLWVTPYRDGQLYASGAYPNQSKQDYNDSLFYYADKSSIYNQDIVLWYSLGHTHLPRPEDFPLISSKKLSVVFYPNGFFERNPAMGFTRVTRDPPPSKQ